MTEAYIDENYVDGTVRLNYCFQHGLFYRPDPRIFPLSATHCPIGNHPLVSWADWVNGRRGDDQEVEKEEIW